MDETSPTARALACLDALQDTPGITAGALGRRLGVSDRAARRYVAVLREAGVPVDSTRGPYGGYRVGRGVRAPLRFSGTEALGLVMAVLDGHHAAGDGTDPVGSAVGKLVRALPEPVARQVEALRRTTAAAPDRGAARPDPAILAPLVTACSERRRVRLDYRSEAGSEWLLEADPWAVVVRHGRWYVVGWSHHAGAVRVYRVDRVRAIDVLTPPFVPPTDLDAVRLLEQHLATGWEYAAEVLVDAPADRVARWLPPALGRVEAVDGQRSRLVGTTSNPPWYAEQLAALRAPFEVVGGPELRSVVGDLGRRLVAASTGVRAPVG